MLSYAIPLFGKIRQIHQKASYSCQQSLNTWFLVLALKNSNNSDYVYLLHRLRKKNTIVVIDSAKAKPPD